MWKACSTMTKCKLSPRRAETFYTECTTCKERLPAIEICSLSGINNPSLNRKDHRVPWIHLVSLLHRRSEALLIFSTVSVDKLKCLAVRVMAQDSPPATRHVINALESLDVTRRWKVQHVVRGRFKHVTVMTKRSLRAPGREPAVLHME